MAHDIRFSAEMDFDVARSGHATVTERCTAENFSQEKIQIGHYTQSLLSNADLSTLRIDIEHAGVTDEMVPELLRQSGTNRRLLRVPRDSDETIVLKPGMTSLVTKYELHNFFDDSSDSCRLFHLHHSIADVPYLKDVTVPKTVRIKIEKPSRFFFSWDALFVERPSNSFDEGLQSFRRHAEFQFSFALSRGQHYHNAVVLHRRSRLGLRVVQLLNSLRTLLKPSGEPRGQ